MTKGPQRLFTEEQELAICEYYWTRQPTGYYPSYVEVAEKFGCSSAHVRNLLKRHNTPRRTQAETRDHRPCKPTNQPDSPAPLCACGCGQPVKWISKERRWMRYVPGHYRRQLPYHDPEWLRTEYETKLRSVQEIADQFGVGQSSVRKAMKKAGIAPRTTSESLTKRGSSRGANNSAWKGGVAKWSYAYNWKSLCKRIKDRDKWECQLCGERRKRWGHKLHVHHIDGDKTNNHPHNLISLCARCHAPIHNDAEAASALRQVAIQNTEKMG